MNRNCAHGILLLAAMALPASAGEIYSFRATDYAIGENVSDAVNGVKIRLISSVRGNLPGIVDDPAITNTETFVPENRWLNGGRGGENSCVPGGLGELLLFEFEQPIERFQLVAYSVTSSTVVACNDDPVNFVGFGFPQETLVVGPPGLRFSVRSTGEWTIDAPLARFYVGSASGFGITEFRAEGVSFVDEPMTGALMLGGVAALTGLRRRRS
jgi:MYXO-CTERM domain-containing protein